jgi:two-component sensor histidine kinase
VAIATEDAPPRVLVTAIDLAWLGARLRERNIAEGSTLTVADRDGTMVAREPEPERFIGRSVEPEVMPLIEADRPGTAEIRIPDGTLRIVGYQPPAATGVGLYVGFGISRDAAFAPVNAATRRTVLLMGAGAGAACLVAWLVGDRLFRRPIGLMLATVASWRGGDETARTGIAADASELSDLAAAIDGYMDNLVAVRAERAAEEERRALLLREMNHRIKNLLAAVQAIANQTFKDRATPDSLRAFGSRLAAMAAAHDLLVTERWESADLRETVAAALAPFGAGQGLRFVVEGPQVRITARAAVSLSMALHELATNAAKYGALRVPAGRVAVRWRLADEDAGRRFHFTWSESGGPPVEEPEKSGFGTKLIEVALASELSGSVGLAFDREGVSFTLDADAAAVLADGSVLRESAA